jgi:hypothetical protein
MPTVTLNSVHGDDAFNGAMCRFFRQKEEGKKEKGIQLIKWPLSVFSADVGNGWNVVETEHVLSYVFGFYIGGSGSDNKSDDDFSWCRAAAPCSHF